MTLMDNYPYIPGLTRSIFVSMGRHLNEYNRRLKEDIFSANKRMNDDSLWVEAYRITIEELLLTI